MIIQLKKFGTVLTSRPSGKEAYAAFLSYLNDILENELIEINFEGVLVLSPSWADEFLRPIIEKYHDRLKLLNLDNPSVQATLRFLNLLNNN